MAEETGSEQPKNENSGDTLSCCDPRLRFLQEVPTGFLIHIIEDLVDHGGLGIMNSVVVGNKVPELTEIEPKLLLELIFFVLRERKSKGN